MWIFLKFDKIMLLIMLFDEHIMSVYKQYKKCSLPRKHSVGSILKAFYSKLINNYIISKNDPFPEKIKIPVGRYCTNGAVYSKFKLKADICSAL